MTSLFKFPNHFREKENNFKPFTSSVANTKEMKCSSESTESHPSFCSCRCYNVTIARYVYVDAKQLSLSLVFNSKFHAKYLASLGAYHPGFVNQSECEILFNYAILDNFFINSNRHLSSVATTINRTES